MKRKSSIALRVILTVLSVLTVGFIFYNSSLNADQSSEHSGRLLEAINSILRSMGFGAALNEHLIRKTAHFVEYFVLGLLLSGTWYAYTGCRKRTLIFAPLNGLLVAVCDEMIQTMSSGRSCEVADMALDFSAVLCASLLMTLILYIIEKKGTRKEGNGRE